MNIVDSTHSFYFDNDGITNEQIETMFTDVMVLVGDVHLNFSLRLEAAETQLMQQRMLVN